MYCQARQDKSTRLVALRLTLRRRQKIEDFLDVLDVVASSVDSQTPFLAHGLARSNTAWNLGNVLAVNCDRQEGIHAHITQNFSSLNLTKSSEFFHVASIYDVACVSIENTGNYPRPPLKVAETWQVLHTCQRQYQKSG